MKSSDLFLFHDRKEKAQAGSAHNWNTLFLGASAVADIMADKYGVSKGDVLSSESQGTEGGKFKVGKCSSSFGGRFETLLIIDFREAVSGGEAGAGRDADRGRDEEVPRGGGDSAGRLRRAAQGQVGRHARTLFLLINATDFAIFTPGRAL